MFVAAWKDAPAAGGGAGKVLAARIDDDGSVLDPGGIALANDSPSDLDAATIEGGSANTPTSITFAGAGFLGGGGVSFQDGSGRMLFTVGLDGGLGFPKVPPQLPWSPGNVSTSWNSPNVEVASTGASSLVEWDWGGAVPSSFIVTTLDAMTDPPLRPSFDTASNHYVTVSSIASDGTSYLLVFTDSPNQWPATSETIWAWRFDASATPSTAQPTLVATVDHGFSTAQVAFDGSAYLLVWDPKDSTGQGDVVGLQLTREGLPTSASPFVIAGSTWNETAPSIASDGAGHALVTYSRFDPSSTFGSMRARARLLDLTNDSLPDATADGLREAGDTAAAPGDASPEEGDAMRGAADGGAVPRDTLVTVSGGCNLGARPTSGAAGNCIVCMAALALHRRRRMAPRAIGV